MNCTKGLVALFCMVAISLTGCDFFRWASYALTDPNEEVKAEYAGLQGRTIAVVIDVDAAISCDHPKVRSLLSDSIYFMMHRNIKDIKTVSPVTVINYQNDHPKWRDQDWTMIGEALKADYLLVISIAEYSSMGSVTGAIQAEIIGDAQLLEMWQNQEGVVEDKVVWPKDGTPYAIEITHPKDAVYGSSGAKVMRSARLLFAQELTQKFHDYERPKDDTFMRLKNK